MSKPNELLLRIADSSVPLKHREQMLREVLISNETPDDAEPQPVMRELLKRFESGSANDLAQARSDALKKMLDALEHSPLRPATFIELAADEIHALVALDNGEFGYVVMPNEEPDDPLKLGDRIALDSHAKIMMKKMPGDFQYGREARLERRVDHKHLEVITTADERSVVLANSKLSDQVESGKVTPGDWLVLCGGGQVALGAVPKPDSAFSHYRFLDRGGIPDVVVERDIGCPPPVIAEVAGHIREEMTRPELRRRFRLRPCITKLLCGVSGSGKTLAIQALHRLMYEIMGQVTGCGLPDLPPRVFRFKTSQMLSMWLGESDKNLDRLFDEVEKLAAQPFVNPKGQSFPLPVMVIMEEADGMGRSRGSDHDGVHDRILTTLLQRLDPNREGLSQRLIVFLATTNEPHIVDPAFLRRLGGTIELFGRLGREAFVDVLRKHVSGMRAAKDGKESQKKLWQTIIDEVVGWLYEAEGDRGVVEVVFDKSSQVKYRRDFLTGGLVDRAVQQAATTAWRESLSDPEAGITAEHLLSAIDRQVTSVVRQLTQYNIGHYLDLPEGERVTKIRLFGRSEK